MITRRSLLAGCVAVAAVSAFPAIPAFAGEVAPMRAGSRLDQLVPLLDPVIDLHNSNTDERLKVRFYTATGYDPEAIRQLNWFARDWRQGEAVQIDVRLLWGLAAIRGAGIKDGNEGLIRFNSGYRSRKTNELLRSEGVGAAVNSFHLTGRAVDFVLPGAPVEDVAKYAEWLEIGGTGHYKGRFVHIDSGKKRRWFG